jgi:hypothetical protein
MPSVSDCLLFRRSPPGFIEKRPHQLWTHLAYEQPYYFPFITEEDFYKRIDVNMTYNQKDHVPITFLCMTRRFREPQLQL